MIENDPREAFNNAQSMLGNPAKVAEAYALYQQCAQDKRAAPELRAAAIVGAGLLMEHVGKLNSALGFYGLALAMQPGCVAARVNLATMNVFDGRIVEAKSDLELLAAEVPEVAAAKYNLGLVLLMLGEYERGLELYEFRPSNQIQIPNEQRESSV